MYAIKVLQLPVRTMEIANTPINAAHAYANAAEEYEEKEQWAKAMEAHLSAAEQFLLAIEYTSDIEAVRTLKLLNSSHQRQGKELERKINKRPTSTSLPTRGSPGQSHSRPAALKSAGPSSATPPLSAPKTYSLEGNGYQSSTNPSFRLRVPQAPEPKHISASVMTSDSQPAGGFLKPKFERTNTTDSTGSAHSINSRIDESSFMVLHDGDNDDSDPFNKFWETVETLLQKLSSPAVAFTTAPLNENDQMMVLDPRTNTLVPLRTAGVGDEPSSGGTPRKDADFAENNVNQLMESFFVVPDQKQKTENNEKRHQAFTGENRPEFTASRNTGLLESVANITPTKTIEEYAIENQQLKIMIDQLSRRVVTLKKNAVETDTLKSDIMMFRHEFHKKAKRILQSQDLMLSSSASIRLPNGSEKFNADNLSVLLRKTKDLQHEIALKDDEIRSLRLENEKQKTSVAKYKERWEKLKESAKKRRGADQNMQGTENQAPHSSRRSSVTVATDFLGAPPFA